MILFFIASCVSVLIFKHPLFENKNGIIEDYLSQDSTIVIKGFFVLCVLMSHFRGYVNLSNSILDQSFAFIIGNLGQLMVVMFLLYGGYGIHEQYKKNGKKYVNSFLRTRLFVTWLSFAICVAIYWIYASCVKAGYSVIDTILAFAGWTAIGNSNWFMFVIFVEYFLFWLAFKNENGGATSLIIFTVLTIVFTGILIITKQSYWWDTAMCFPAGMWFSRYKEKIDCYIAGHDKKYFSLLLLTFVLFAATWVLSLKVSHAFYLAAAVLFALLVVIITMKVKFRGRIAAFYGRHVFSVYMLQRLVFMILQNEIHNTYLYFFISVVATTIIAVLFDKAFKYLKYKIV